MTVMISRTHNILYMQTGNLGGGPHRGESNGS
jgi:hypothetical protein